MILLQFANHIASGPPPHGAFLAMGLPAAAAAAAAAATASSSSPSSCKSTCQTILRRAPRNHHLGLVTGAATLGPFHTSALYLCQAKWNLGESIKKVRRGFKSAHLDGYHYLQMCFTLVTRSANQPEAASSREGSFWQSLFPRGPIYTSDISDVDPVQLRELWFRTLRVERDPDKIIKALRHSFAFVVVLVEDEGEPAPRSAACNTRWKTVGVGRAVSDGYFIATICDVAVDPAYRHRGIGRRIVKKLVEKMKGIGRGPSGFAVFPPPPARRFFWKIGFRPDRNYKMMAYRGGKRYEDEQIMESGRADAGELWEPGQQEVG